jgi:tetratricopeptide (TPR) repeat protein
MVWPERLLADYSYAVVRPTTSPLEPFFLLGITTLAVLGFVKYRSWRGTGAALVAVAAFAFSYILVSNSVILIAVMMAERWFYAPSAWLTILVVMAGRRVLAGSLSAERWPRLHQLAAPQAALVVIVAVLCVRTWYRNADWGSFDRLLAADVRATPPGGRSAHFQASLAARQVAQGRLGEAEANAREAVATYPESATIQCVLGEVLLARGKTAEAVEVLEEARRIDPRDPQVAAALEQSRLAAAGEDARAGLERTLAVLKVRPGDADAQYQAGYYLEALGEFQQAAGHYRRAAELQPQRVKAWLAWAGALAAAACPAEAIDVYRQILARWPNEWQAHANIAMQLMQKAAGTLWQPEEAVRHAERALQLGPAEMRLQLTINLAEVLYEVGQSARAADVYDGLVRSLPSDDPQRSRYRERIEYLRGQ